jgi:bifunctional non-homologous end joining protein LigD
MMAAGKLSLYQAKRDFTKTAEPSGKARVKAAQYARFVVQKHAATRLHYDLRLEVNGVFKSWAVTKGPSLDPRDRRLAVEVEDHPLDYGDFEGTIPEGEYGGGTVMLWDRGFWEPEGDADPERALRKGELKFTLAGEKLKGGWVLVRMRRNERDRRNNWLLIKHRDGYVRENGRAVTEQDRSVASGRTMDDIAGGKGARPKPFMLARKAAQPDAVWHSNRNGKTSKASLLEPIEQTTTRAVPKKQVAKRGASTMPQFIAPQLCRRVTRPPVGTDWVHEIKLDGYRMQLRVENGEAVMRTRKGLDWTSRFLAIADAAKGFDDCIIDGEVVALDHNGASDFAALQAALSEGDSKALTYFVFDLLCAEGEDLRPLPLTERKERLQRLLAGNRRAGKLIKFVEHLTEPGDAVLQSACRMKLEGIISKSAAAPYQSGRTDTWQKAKCRGGQEVVIGGWSGSARKLRSLLVGVYRGDHLVHTGRVGTGFNKRNSSGLLKKLLGLATAKSPFGGAGAPRKDKDVTWVKPQLIAEIEFAGWTADGLVRQAAFKGLREDKPASEVQAEHAVPPEELASTAAEKLKSSDGARAKPPDRTKQHPGRSQERSHDNVVLGVGISNPDKLLWPPEANVAGYSKIDLARYLEDVGPWMIEHLKGRPCSIIRTPDGINAQRFFQRHAMRGMSNLISLATVGGDRKPYLQIDRVEGLIAAAQIATVEYHPWNNQPGRPQIPGRLVFDLDPAPDVPFDLVIAAGKELKARLEKLGLETFCKTTGGKGLHVVTPLAFKGDSLGWKEAKAFARAVCSQMADDSPDRYLIVMTKKQRTGRIFLDYLRNDLTASAVAPLSPRARPGAPVSMPLSWSQLKTGLDPQHFTMGTAPALLKKSKPWRDYCEAERPLKNAIEKLAKLT